MAILFLANALFWGYRAGATLARAYLGWEAERRGTTLDIAFQRAERRRARGEFSDLEAGLLDFVKFNDAWAWESLQDFAIDTSAVATAGAGLAAKLGLGKRLAAVLGVKSAPLTGTIIDAVLDLVGSTIGGNIVNPAGRIKEILNLIAKTEGAVGALAKVGGNLVNATVKLGAVIGPLLGPTPGGVIGKALQVGIAAPNILNAAVDVFASIMGFWAVAEPLLPEIPAKSIDLPIDPQFRAAVEEFNKKQIFPLDPGLRGRPPTRPRAEPQAEPPPVVGPPGPARPLTTLTTGEILPGLQSPITPPAGGLQPITLEGVVRKTGDLTRATGPFIQRLSARIGLSDFARILEELRKG